VAGTTGVDPSTVAGAALGTITESGTGFSAPGLAIGSTTGQHGAIVYGSNTMYFGTESGSDNTMQTRMTLTSAGALSTAGNITGGNISTGGNITGSYILGNGSQLTGLPASYGNANAALLMANFGSNNISTSGNITAGYYFGNGSQLTGLVASNISGSFSTVTASGLISTSGNVVGSNVNATSNLSAGGTIRTSGSGVFGDILANGSGTISASGTISGANFSTTGNVTGANIVTGGAVSASGNISAGGRVIGGYVASNTNFAAGPLTTTTAGEGTYQNIYYYSTYYQTILNGSGAANWILPNSQTMIANGTGFQFNNLSTNSQTILTSGGSTLATLPARSTNIITCVNNTASPGLTSNWNVRYLAGAASPAFATAAVGGSNYTRWYDATDSRIWSAYYSNPSLTRSMDVAVQSALSSNGFLIATLVDYNAAWTYYMQGPPAAPFQSGGVQTAWIYFTVPPGGSYRLTAYPSTPSGYLGQWLEFYGQAGY